jgi:hypothetical protein
MYIYTVAERARSMIRHACILLLLLVLRACLDGPACMNRRACMLQQ